MILDKLTIARFKLNFAEKFSLKLSSIRGTSPDEYKKNIAQIITNCLSEALSEIGFTGTPQKIMSENSQIRDVVLDIFKEFNILDQNSTLHLKLDQDNNIVVKDLSIKQQFIQKVLLFLQKLFCCCIPKKSLNDFNCTQNLQKTP